MFKFLIILGLIVYLIYKVGSWFYRAGAASQHFRNQQQNQYNSNSANNQNGKKPNSKFKGGEYIDYEEVK